MVHKPVLLGEAIDNLNINPGDTVIDCTLGAGGHSAEILKRIAPDGKLISIDWDERAVENFRKNIFEKKGIRACPAPINNNKNSDRFFPENKKLGNRGENIATCWFGAAPATIANNNSKPENSISYWYGASDNYANLEQIIRGLARLDSPANRAWRGVKTADAILLDLGFSSDQIEDPERGFSFRKDGPLDMRYSQSTQKMTAADVVNEYSEKKLVEIFQKYGEEKYARKIAREVVKERKAEKIRKTGQLAGIILKATPRMNARSGIHPATRVFQALRIEVNQELENLEKFLDQAVEVLAGGGRLAVISFHSLEDRIVKHFFQKESRDCVCPPSFPRCVCRHKKQLKIITKKPIGPGKEETRGNPRARSAKLRVAEKI